MEEGGYTKVPSLGLPWKLPCLACHGITAAWKWQRAPSRIVIQWPWQCESPQDDARCSRIEVFPTLPGSQGWVQQANPLGACDLLLNLWC